MAFSRSTTFAALANPNYRLYFRGQAISLTGTWMQMTAQAWLVLSLTHSAAKLGLVVALQTLPVIVYTGRMLSGDEEHRLRRYSKSIIIKGAKSPERLLDEVTLFLHSVESSLAPEQQRMLRTVRQRALEDRVVEPPAI